MSDAEEGKQDTRVNKLLKILVERAVRPVRASVICKRKMRHDLLSHVTAVFEEEITKLGDVRAALEQTAARFGDPIELTKLLQETVPARDRVNAFFQQITDFRPSETVLMRALRQGLWIGLLIGGVTTLTVAPMILLGLRRPPDATALGSINASAVVIGFAYTLLGNWLRKALFGEVPSWLMASIWMVSIYLVVPTVLFFDCAVITRDAEYSLAATKTILLFALAGPLHLFIQAAAWTSELRYREEWSSLPLSEN